MAHPVARSALPDAELAAGAAQKEVVVGIAVVSLQEIVVHVGFI
jgi:hypothetical protein